MQSLVCMSDFTKFYIPGLMQAMYGYNRPDLICPNEEVYCHYISPNSFLEYFSMERESFWTDIGYLFGVAILIRVATYYAVKRKLARL